MGAGLIKGEREGSETHITFLYFSRLCIGCMANL